MSDWEDVYGVGNLDPFSHGSRYEDDVLEKDKVYRTMGEWNSLGRKVKRGSKCYHSNHFRLFETEQTVALNDHNRYIYFDTFKKAASYAKTKPGSTIFRVSERNGFVIKFTC